ncbi:MAG: ABC transporter ATP-binding protein [Acidimicrobiales bacterium]
MSGGLRVSELAITRKGDGGAPAIGPLSFQVEGGSAIGIVGESGSGKTLSLRAMMGLPPSGFERRGELHFVGDARALDTDEALRAELGRRLGVVLQDPFSAFDPLKSVGVQISEGVVRRGILRKDVAHQRACTLLAQMGFPIAENILGLYRHQLSGGMAQRIAIAMAVMPQPAVVLADEPTSSLDASLRIGVLGLLRDYISANDAVLVMVSHDLGLIARFCEQLIVMYAGRVVERGPARALLDSPQHPYTQALVACAPYVGAEGRRRLPSIQGSAASPFQHGKGCRFASRCPFVMERCRLEEPELTDAGRTSVACHLVQMGSLADV